MAIDEQEGLILATATANLLAQFDIAPDPKTQAIIGMIMAAGTVYGPRVYLINVRKAQEKAERKANVKGDGIAGMTDAQGNPIGTAPFNMSPGN